MIKHINEAESFPLKRYTPRMYPPHVTDAAVRAVIDELTVEDCIPSGASVRAVLKERYGSPGGVTRIYRLLSGVRLRRAPAREVGDAEALERELTVIRERAERAEQREVAHQSRWAIEVDQLRLKVATYEPLVQQARATLESVGLLRRQLQAAEARIASLEQQLLEKQGRGG